MEEDSDLTAESLPLREPSTRWGRTIAFALQVSLVLALLLVWLSSGAVRASKSLWVLFLYSLPSEFLIAVVPHEPVIVYFGKFYPPVVVALVSVAGTLLAEALNYSVFGYVVDTRTFRRIRYRGFVERIVALFRRAPFAALCVAGFTPIPFYPFRLLVVLARYPIVKYLLALLLSRTPRFYILAYLGSAIGIPDYLLLALFAVLVLVALAYGGVARNALQKMRVGADRTDQTPKTG
jgi:membrane protein YqaA with SNARE-associated domain